MTVELLIKQKEKELQDIKRDFDVKEIRDISNVRYRSFAEAIQNFLVELKSLPNEPKTVSNNEQKKKICHICGGEGEHTSDCGATIFVDLT